MEASYHTSGNLSYVRVYREKQIKNKCFIFFICLIRGKVSINKWTLEILLVHCDYVCHLFSTLSHSHASIYVECFSNWSTWGGLGSLVFAADFRAEFGGRGWGGGGQAGGSWTVPPQAQLQCWFCEQWLDQCQVQTWHAPSIQVQDLITWTQTWRHKNI